jgi:hypothetical protein
MRYGRDENGCCSREWTAVYSRVLWVMHHVMSGGGGVIGLNCYNLNLPFSKYSIVRTHIGLNFLLHTCNSATLHWLQSRYHVPPSPPVQISQSSRGLGKSVDSYDPYGSTRGSSTRAYHYWSVPVVKQIWFQMTRSPKKYWFEFI